MERRSSWAGRKGSYSGRQTSAGCGRAERRDFLRARYCGRSRADLLLERQSAALLPSCARPKRRCSDGRERDFQRATEFGKHQRQGDEDDDDDDEEHSLSHTKKRKRAIYMLQEVVDFAMTTEEGGGGAANKHHVYGFRAFHSVSTTSPVLEWKPHDSRLVSSGLIFLFCEWWKEVAKSAALHFTSSTRTTLASLNISDETEEKAPLQRKWHGDRKIYTPANCWCSLPLQMQRKLQDKSAFWSQTLSSSDHICNSFRA